MQSFLNKIILFFKTNPPDAEIIGDVKFYEDNSPYFVVKMRGCQTLVDIKAEDIVEKFTNKFTQIDIKNATKITMKYRSLLKLVSIEKNMAILFNNQEHSYQLVDLTDSLFIRTLNMNNLRAEDAFNLGIHYERLRAEKDNRLFKQTKAKHSLTKLKLVKPDD